MLAVLIAVETWGEALEDKYVRVFVDNSEELYSLIRPGTSASPLAANLSMLVRLKLMRMNAIPYFSYIASDRNVSDLWTRPSLVRSWVDEVNRVVLLDEAKVDGRVEEWLKTSVGALVKEIGVVAEVWARKHGF